MKGEKIHLVAAVLAVAAGGLAVWPGLAQANGTGTHDVRREPLSSVSVEDRIRINEKDGAQLIHARITVEPGGHTPWHYHPGPHLVSVVTGTVEIYETDCDFRTYPAGTGFFDPGPTHRPHVHTLRNPSATDPAEVLVTDIRSDDPRPTVEASPQPAPCFS